MVVAGTMVESVGYPSWLQALISFATLTMHGDRQFSHHLFSIFHNLSATCRVFVAEAFSLTPLSSH